VAFALVLTLSIPGWRVAAIPVHAQTVIDPAKLRIPADAFSPATVTTDQVENNDDASSNYVGSHHPGSYTSLGRISGYYQRSVYQGDVYLRFQSSTFASEQDATDVLTTSINWASTHFGGPTVCAGQQDDTLDPNGNVIDSDNPDINHVNINTIPAANGDDLDPSCQLPDFAGAGSSGDCDANDADENGQPPDATDQDLGCELTTTNTLVTPPEGTGTTVSGTDDCNGQPDNDDNGSSPGTPDAAGDCIFQGVVSPSADQVFAFPITVLPGDVGDDTLQSLVVRDCSPLVQATCQMIGYGYQEPGIDRMWYDVYVVFQVHQCLGEITLTSRPEAYGTIQPDGILTAASAVLQKTCGGTAAK